MGRLKRGVSASQAAARLKMLAPQIYREAFEQQGLAREDGRRLRTEDRDRYLRADLRYPVSPRTARPLFAGNTVKHS